MIRNIDIDLHYQGLIDSPPVTVDELYKRACSGDSNTVDHWRKKWLDNYKAAKDHFGSLGEKSYGQLYGLNRHKPAICIGSGPSLKESIPALKENASLKNPLLTISCLHNFGYFEDEGFHADYYLSLDSGGVVIDDVSESRNKDGNFYWEKTKGKKLIAYISSDPRLWELWQGEIYLFNSAIPDRLIMEEFKKVENFSHVISSGGNALGACMYTAKAVMGSTSIIYVGADFCFSWDNEFHSYKTQYDTQGHVIMWPDVFGIPRKTWQSYLNFKFWFDRTACSVPGTWINASEGLLGAYKEGNIKQFKYCTLGEAIYPHKCAEVVVEQEFEAKADGTKEVIGSRDLDLGEYYKNPDQQRPITLF